MLRLSYIKPIEFIGFAVYICSNISAVDFKAKLVFLSCHYGENVVVKALTASVYLCVDFCVLILPTADKPLN